MYRRCDTLGPCYDANHGETQLVIAKTGEPLSVSVTSVVTTSRVTITSSIPFQPRPQRNDLGSVFGFIARRIEIHEIRPVLLLECFTIRWKRGSADKGIELLWFLTVPGLRRMKHRRKVIRPSVVEAPTDGEDDVFGLIPKICAESPSIFHPSEDALLPKPPSVHEFQRLFHCRIRRPTVEVAIILGPLSDG